MLSNCPDNLNGAVVIDADCNPKGGGFDSRKMLDVCPLRKRGWRTFLKQTNLGKEDFAIGFNILRLRRRFS
jgi:hypothetical protein